MNVDALDTDVKEFYRKGLQLYGAGGVPLDPAGPYNVIGSHGVVLVYKEEISPKDAVLLQRLLSAGAHVMSLSLYDTSRGAFEVPFDDHMECPSLQHAYIGIDCEGEDLGTNFSNVFGSLRSLELNCYNTGSGFATQIASYIRDNKCLRELILWNSCGGDEGAEVLIEALGESSTLKKFTLSDMKLSSGTLVGFAEMLVSNPTLELNLAEVCSVDKEIVSSLLAQDRFSEVFKRLDVVWLQDVLPELTMLIRRETCYPDLRVSVSSSAGQGVLKEFFDAVAEAKTIRRINFYHNGDTFDALADGIAFAVERTTTIQEIVNDMDVARGEERQLIRVLDALKENHSVTNFTMRAEFITPGIATSLSELLVVNDVLWKIDVFDNPDISPEELNTILEGLRSNYTLTSFMDCEDTDQSEEVLEMQALLERNFSLLHKAAQFVISGGDVNDDEGLQALMKVHSSAGLVESVMDSTNMTREEALKDIQQVVDCFSAYVQ
ncbi:hypothetical protein HPB50_008036 [Hyalomma asiaticum]|uniref:Uncharacterized protein n=1 Tax=Hyalomma asiaticum TaxID=266040 RepID=A0ACB7RNH9_HYAAI|nr:hypothetical protein HPB50_008036 [Hyalomma asiaticum]